MDDGTHLERADQAAGDRPPGVIFTMRYPSDVGFVWKTIALHRDLIARAFGAEARCLLAYPLISDTPAYQPRWSRTIQADFYDYSAENRQRLEQLITDEAIRLVVFMSVQPADVDLGFLRRLGLRTVTSENNSYDHSLRQPLVKRLAKTLIRRVLKRQVFDLHIANSQAQYDFLRGFAQLPASRLRAVRNGIDTDHFQPGERASACAKLGLDPDRLWIMAASQARPEKRLERVLAVIRAVKDARPALPIGFFFVGEGENLAEWRQIALGLPDAETYRFFGRQSDLRPYYQAASVFIHGAFRESFGLVIAEAMASGLPVVATHAHGPAEIIAEGETGRLVGRDDWEGLGKAALEYLDDAELRRTHGLAGRARCVALFSITRQAREFADLLRPFLKDDARAPY
ncbi:glycosyl transferase family 1 [Rhodospirillum rubrum]|uniref:glycosyltransferase family 4 protein n=1 Tax=Rhodospirillum rubrum TaxID=1085 RepID=UPI00190579A1|nr:glycosyltransferase family 4 protein [Rhodospirillum rubrum]MBK1664526.1 glycosyl transferase family 1 [Rhodospirillum rubrum]MBK1676219.1 glycosyl transferase family 1 [Rhodospirillum rubrum]